MTKQYQFNEHILIVGEKTVKKDDGINAVLGLLKDLRAFQDKMNACLESQNNVEIRQRIERHADSLNTMYSDLIEIASGGVRDIRKRPESEEQYSGETLPKESTESTVTAPIEPTMSI